MWGRRKAETLAFRREAIAHADALYRFARYLSGSDHDADDLVQETYARALTAAEMFTAGTNLKAWLYRIARNAFIDRWRREVAGPVAATDDVDAVTLTDAPLAMVAADAVRSADVQAAMMALPEPSRTVVLLDLEGFAENEVATILGCAPGTVKSRLFRARAALREHLKDYAPARRLHGL